MQWGGVASIKWGRLAIFAAAAVALKVCSDVTKDPAGTSQSPPPPPKPSIELSLSSNSRGFVITNKGPVPITNCNVYVNSRYHFRRGFTVQIGYGFDIWYTELVTDNDVRYSPLLERFDRFHIICNEGDALFK